jgi:hypothetical protein
MTNVSRAKIKRIPIIFSHYLGRAGEETQGKPCVRWQKGPKIGYLLIHSCEGWANFQLYWWLAMRKGFRYDHEQSEASWQKEGERRRYKYPA